MFGASAVASLPSPARFRHKVIKRSFDGAPGAASGDRFDFIPGIKRAFGASKALRCPRQSDPALFDLVTDEVDRLAPVNQNRGRAA